MDGLNDGKIEGAKDGSAEGVDVGIMEGYTEGSIVGLGLGSIEGVDVGLNERGSLTVGIIFATTLLNAEILFALASIRRIVVKLPLNTLCSRTLLVSLYNFDSKA